MFTAKLCLLLAMAGQCADGRCPAPPNFAQYTRPAVYDTIPSGRYWHQTPTVGWVRGWIDANGYVRYVESENPDSASTRERLALQAIQSVQAPKTPTWTIPRNPEVMKPVSRKAPTPQPTPTPTPPDDDDSPLFPLSDPVMKPVGFKVGEDIPDTNYGIDNRKTFTTPRGQNHFETTGPKSEAFAEKVKTVIQEQANDESTPALTDDSHMPFVVIIGTEEEQKLVLERLKGLKGIAHLCAFSKDNWVVKDSGHVRKDSSGQELSEIVVQQAAGKVQARLPITTPAEPVIEAVHRADPTYDASKDPGASSGSGPTTLRQKVIAGLMAVGAIVALIGGILFKMLTPLPSGP